MNPLPDLADAIVGGWDFVDNDPVPQDTNGHGTQVASVIAARGNNAIGMAGHCWGCRIMPIRVSAGGSVNPHLIASGIYYAVEHGARVIDISLTRPGSPHWAEEGAVRYALDRGVVVVASAGNNGNDVQQYPGAYPGVLAVGATDDADALYFWSSHGPWVALTAPGCHLVLNPFAGTLCGTSFTPAAVAGVAGLLLSRNPGLTRHQITAALAATARPIPGIAFGRVNAYAAFEFLGLLPPAQAQGGTGATPPSTTTTTPRPRAPAPGQLYTRQQHFETGSFRRGFRATLADRPRPVRGPPADAARARLHALAANAAGLLRRLPGGEEPPQPLRVGSACRPVHARRAVPRCTRPAVLARRHCDVPSRRPSLASLGVDRRSRSGVGAVS